MIKNVIRYSFLFFAFLLCPITLDFLYNEIELPYFRFLLYLGSFSFLSLFFLPYLQKFKRLYVTITNLVVLILLVCVAEFFFFYMNEKSSNTIVYSNVNPYTHEPEMLTIPDSALGYKMKPDLKLQSTMTVNGDTIYSSYISGNSQGWRTTPYDSIKNKSAVFLGCSFTFGAGLNDDQTLPYLIGSKSDYNSYNFAFGGYGPQHTLLTLNKNTLAESAQTKVFYVYIDGHIRRVGASYSIVNSYGKNFPYPSWENDSLHMYSSFTEKSPFLSRLYSALSDCQTIKFFGVDFPLFLSDKHFELCGKTIETLAKSVMEKYQTKLILVVYPGSLQHQEVLKHIDSSFIEVLDYSAFCEKGNEKYFFKNDGHPNALLNKTIADRILRDVFR